MNRILQIFKITTVKKSTMNMCYVFGLVPYYSLKSTT